MWAASLSTISYLTENLTNKNYKRKWTFTCPVKWMSKLIKLIFLNWWIGFGLWYFMFNTISFNFCLSFLSEKQRVLSRYKSSFFEESIELQMRPGSQFVNLLNFEISCFRTSISKNMLKRWSYIRGTYANETQLK